MIELGKPTAPGKPIECMGKKFEEVERDILDILNKEDPEYRKQFSHLGENKHTSYHYWIASTRMLCVVYIYKGTPQVLVHRSVLQKNWFPFPDRKQGERCEIKLSYEELKKLAI